MTHEWAHKDSPRKLPRNVPRRCPWKCPRKCPFKQMGCTVPFSPVLLLDHFPSESKVQQTALTRSPCAMDFCVATELLGIAKSTGQEQEVPKKVSPETGNRSKKHKKESPETGNKAARNKVTLSFDVCTCVFLLFANLLEAGNCWTSRFVFVAWEQKSNVGLGVCLNMLSANLKEVPRLRA